MTRQDKPPTYTLALFDFDGTLTTRDSMIEFTRFACGGPRFFLGLVSLLPMLIRFRLGLLDRTKAKERWLSHFMKGKTINELKANAKVFSETVLPFMIRKAGMDRLHWHQNQGHICYLVTASLDIWTMDWANRHQLTLISTVGEVIEGKFTGKLQGPNCWGKEKRKRVEAITDPQSIELIYAYGDSLGDQALLQWADYAFYKPFR